MTLFDQGLGEALKKAQTLMLNAGLEEAHIEVEWFFESLGFTRIQQSLYPEAVLTPEQQVKIEQFIARRKNREPLQYILGLAPFRQWEFKVTPAVLIPRPETEELVSLVLSNHDSNALKLAEMGTGSGAIALSLCLERPLWNGFATDISLAALGIAQDNAKSLNLTEINFEQGEFLIPFKAHAPFDIFVSNPPYVPLDDLSRCAPEVKKFEPHLALTPGADPLLFYKKFATGLPQILKPGGALYLELDSNHASEVEALFFNQGVYSQIKIHSDMQKNLRFLSAHFTP